MVGNLCNRVRVLLLNCMCHAFYEFGIIEFEPTAFILNYAYNAKNLKNKLFSLKTVQYNCKWGQSMRIKSTLVYVRYQRIDWYMFIWSKNVKRKDSKVK